MTISKIINVIIENDTNNFSGQYNYIQGSLNYYEKDDQEYLLVYSSGGVSFLNKDGQYYWLIPCNDFELLYNKTIPFNKNSGGTANVTVTPISEKKRSRRGNKIKWI